MADAKEALIRAGERLFARHGVHRTQIKEINVLAGQRNVSALHYHFGSRDGLLQAIVEQHSSVVDADRSIRLAAAGEQASLAQLVGVILAPLAEELASPSGRDYLRIVPQLLDGDTAPPALLRSFALARERLSGLPAPIRDERLAAMFRAATTLLASRARTVDDGLPLSLPAEQFVANLIAMATAMLTAPVPGGA